MKSSFESGDFTGWTIQGKGWSIYAKAASNGEKSAMCSIAKGDAPEMKACVRTIAKADAGWVVKGSVDVAGKIKGNSKATVVLMCIDAEGKTLRESKKVITKPSATFQTITLSDFVVPSGTAETYLMLVVETIKTSTAKEWWRFDNVVVEVE
ncbi:hypothetical protein PDESU_03139 [Pontiella desulfatans]|uniref:CBM-cenC domain-containing protein n=1 Tax=Pontiella desulfatans TaxID=2750659 RepID=A0A6C2U599_PONDE|nr:hypothetical protein [Pontiella desulfatans]VGO14576.1 hypothetical protein PDESU_03139 [Pontiella desulfatans]